MSGYARVPWFETDFAVQLVHLTEGWRHWAWHRETGEDAKIGLREDGYGTEDEARAAIHRVVVEHNRDEAKRGRTE
jgi:hypothetical protein